MGLITDVLASVLDAVPALPGSDTIIAELALIRTDAISTFNVLAESRLLFYLMALAAAYVIYWFLFAKLFYTRRVHEVGYITTQRQSQVERANEVRRRRQRGDLPPVYPNGWYRLCEAHDLKKGGKLHLRGSSFFWLSRCSLR